MLVDRQPRTELSSRPLARAPQRRLTNIAIIGPLWNEGQFHFHQEVRSEYLSMLLVIPITGSRKPPAIVMSYRSTTA